MIDEAYEQTILKYCKGYPKELSEYTSDDLLGISLNGAVLDMKNMRLVKVSSDNTIMRAYFGF